MVDPLRTGSFFQLPSSSSIFPSQKPLTAQCGLNLPSRAQDVCVVAQNDAMGSGPQTFCTPTCSVPYLNTDFNFGEGNRQFNCNSGARPVPAQQDERLLRATVSSLRTMHAVRNIDAQSPYTPSTRSDTVCFPAKEANRNLDTRNFRTEPLCEPGAETCTPRYLQNFTPSLSTVSTCPQRYTLPKQEVQLLEDVQITSQLEIVPMKRALFCDTDDDEKKSFNLSARRPPISKYPQEFHSIVCSTPLPEAVRHAANVVKGEAPSDESGLFADTTRSVQRTDPCDRDSVLSVGAQPSASDFNLNDSRDAYHTAAECKTEDLSYHTRTRNAAGTQNPESQKVEAKSSIDLSNNSRNEIDEDRVEKIDPSVAATGARNTTSPAREMSLNAATRDTPYLVDSLQNSESGCAKHHPTREQDAPAREQIQQVDVPINCEETRAISHPERFNVNSPSKKRKRSTRMSEVLRLQRSIATAVWTDSSTVQSLSEPVFLSDIIADDMQENAVTGKLRRRGRFPRHFSQRNLEGGKSSSAWHMAFMGKVSFPHTRQCKRRLSRRNRR